MILIDDPEIAVDHCLDPPVFNLDRDLQGLFLPLLGPVQITEMPQTMAEIAEDHGLAPPVPSIA